MKKRGRKIDLARGNASGTYKTYLYDLENTFLVLELHKIYRSIEIQINS